MAARHLPLATLLILGVSGACGDDGSSVEPSINGVFPGSLFTGRTSDVTISGFGTDWGEAAAIDFGEGVEVDQIVVASPTALVATVRVDGTAAVGARDVTVTEGDQALVYAGGFRLESPIEAQIVGTAAQGSILDVTLRSRDFEIPFDDTSTGDGFFTPLVYPNFTMDLGRGVVMIAGSLSVTPFEASARFLVDVTAAAGPRDIVVMNGPPGMTEELRGASGLDLAARTAVPLELGASVTGTEDEPFGTQLYSMTPNAGHVVDLRSSAANPDALPSVAVLSSSGSFDDVLAFSDRDFFEATAASTFYLVYWDRTGTEDYAYTLRASQVLPATTLDEAAPEPDNDTQATALPAGGPLPVRLSGALEAAGDQDWFAVTIEAADAGRTLTVGTYGGDYFTDTVIEVFGPDGTTSLGRSLDAVYLDSVDVPSAAGGGTHYIKLSYSSYGFDPSQTRYRAIVKLE
jgi:hypothetical protein